MKVLHVVGGKPSGGAYVGAHILHKALLELKIDSKILNNNISASFKQRDSSIVSINDKLLNKIKSNFFIFFEKVFKSILLPIPREAFTFGIIGFDITKLKEYNNADIIHIHWLNSGFINFKSISKIEKPVVWTMRDMWPFTGGAHYTMDFKKYENSIISKYIKNLKKKSFKRDIKFISISNWLKQKAEKSYVLKDFKIKNIYNNIDFQNFKLIEKENAKSKLKINTNKKIILFGANNPQLERKGWKIFSQTLKKIDKSKYFLFIFGRFWSSGILENIGIEYKNFGHVSDKKFLNLIYSSSDMFIAASIQEAFGKTWAEAMACGLPIVCFKETSAAEIVEHKFDGYVVDKIDEDKLLEGINWLASSHDHLTNRDRIRNKAKMFEAQKIANNYIEIYKSFLNNT